jgi:hypothetical protein
MEQNCYLARLPLSATQIVIGTTMMHSTCQSEHPRPIESKEEAPSSAPKKAKKLSTWVAIRNPNNSFEFGISGTLCCS